MRGRRVAGVVLAVTAGLFSMAPAARGFGASPEMGTSIRGAGMGGATTAVTWGEPGPWGNPASLASVQGVGWLEGSTRLQPDSDAKTRLSSRRFLAGAAGLGVSLMGEPVEWLGRTRIIDEYYGTDTGGNPVGPYEIGEKVEGWGFGVSPLTLLDKFSALRPSGAGSLARIVDVRAGYQHKRTSIVLSPGLPEATAENFDWGFALRVSLVPGAMDGRSTRLELAGGLAEINADESSHFTLPGYGDIGPSTRIRRTGVAAHAVFPFGADPGPDGDSAPWSWWPASLPSAVELGLAYDREERREGGAAAAEIADHWGFEGSFMRILFARAGYNLDEVRQLHHVSAGLGLHAPIGPWATVGYDWANVPVGNGLKNQNRHGFSAWLQPAAIWKAWRGGS